MTIARRHLPFIETPAGILRGHEPWTCQLRLLEHTLSSELADKVDGLVEVGLKYGRADVANATHIWEVEPFTNWRHGIRQALQYSAQSGLQPAVGFFGEISKESMLKLFLRLRDGYPPISLWWRGPTAWSHIRSRPYVRGFKAPEFWRGSHPNPEVYAYEEPLVVTKPITLEEVKRQARLAIRRLNREEAMAHGR